MGGSVSRITLIAPLRASTKQNLKNWGVAGETDSWGSFARATTPRFHAGCFLHEVFSNTHGRLFLTRENTGVSETLLNKF
jgi:hypothetical protein